MPATLSPEMHRRSFLAYCSSLGLGSSLFPGALWAQSDGGESEITADMIARATKLVGLDFAESDIEEMVKGINDNLASFRELRTLEIDQNIPPPLYFNPAVPGQTFPHERRPFVLGARERVFRPNNLQDAAFWPVTALAALVESRQVTATELTRMYIDRIRRFDGALRSVITLTEDLAMQQAARADAEIAGGEYRGVLHGIPWGAKDLLAARGYNTTWGFEAYRDQVIDMDATVVERLEQAGAVLIAKLSSGEIARGDVWFGGQTMNPWNTQEGAGGSSAGPGSATAAGLVGFSIGTDTTGSIRGPARSNGITGLRPTFGRVSRHGVMPISWSLDTVGPMCRSVEDCAVVLDAIHGPDGQDLAVTDKPFNWDGKAEFDGMRVGYLEEDFDRETEDAAAKRNDEATLEVLRDLGVDFAPLDLPEHADMDALQMLLVDEAAAFDELVHNGGIEYFRRDIDEPEDMLMRIARLHPAVEYVQIHRRRMLLMQGMAETFAELEVLVAPTFSDSSQGDAGTPIQSATSLTGHPTVVIPNGFDDNGMPTGMQFIGRLYGEAEAMLFAKAVQDATDFHRRRPPRFA